MSAACTRHRGWLGASFVVEHTPVGPVTRAPAVVILPSLGYEDTCAYRPLRILADALAERGHVVLRLDWPGLGDAAGDDATPDLVAAMITAASAAAAELRRRGATEVVGVGLRAGGLLGLAATGFDAWALWAPPASGKALLREERAFHKMAEKYFGDPPEGVAQPPAGAVEAGGFLYRAETVAALEPLVAAELLRARRPARLLILPRDGAEPPEALVRAAEDVGTAVVVGPAEGLADLLENPYEAALVPPVRDAILGFVSTGAPGPRLAPSALSGTLALPGGAFEQPWVGRGAVGELSGIVCEPAGGAPPGATWTVFFNAGGIRRSGPNRLWTRAARTLAARGHPSIRFDVHDVGDSDGATLPHHDLDEMYSQPTINDALVAVDHVQDRGAGAIDVVGLCSGAFFGMQVAAQRSVRRATLFNGPAYVWNEEARNAGTTTLVTRSLLDARRWRRLLAGRIDARALARSLAGEARQSAARRLARLRGEGPPDEVAELLARVVRRGTELHFVNSAGDPAIDYLEVHLPPEIPARRTVLPGVDHTIRPVWAHTEVVGLIVS